MKRFFLAVLVFMQACSYHLGPFSSSEKHFTVGQIDVRSANPELERAVYRAAMSAVSLRHTAQGEAERIHFNVVKFEDGVIAPNGKYFRLSITLVAKTDDNAQVTVQGARQYTGGLDPEANRLKQIEVMYALAHELIEEAVVRLTLKGEEST